MQIKSKMRRRREGLTYKSNFKKIKTNWWKEGIFVWNLWMKKSNETKNDVHKYYKGKKTYKFDM